MLCDMDINFIISPAILRTRRNTIILTEFFLFTLWIFGEWGKCEKWDPQKQEFLAYSIIPWLSATIFYLKYFCSYFWRYKMKIGDMTTRPMRKGHIQIHAQTNPWIINSLLGWFHICWHQEWINTANETFPRQQNYAIDILQK